MTESTPPEIEAILARLEELESAVAELTEELAGGGGGVPDSNLMLMPGLVVYFPNDDNGNVIVVAASSRRLPVVAVPARPTVREWVGILHHTEQWPSGVVLDRVENLLLRVIDPHLDGVPIDLLDAAAIERAVTTARLTDDERATARQLLEFAAARAVAKGKAPAL